MALVDDLKNQVATIFAADWASRDGTVVPTPDAIKLANDAVKFDLATVLYADLSQSTALVDTKKWWFAAEIYKTYLHCAARLIKEEGGTITSYDGDRVMGIFVGDRQRSRAVRCGLKIHYAVTHILNPAIEAQYGTNTYTVQHVVGIDVSPISAARTGVRGDNDIVWVGRAANYAAKLTSLSSATPTWITEDVFSKLANDAKFSGSQLIWEKWNWTQNNNHVVYSSTYWMSI